MKGYVYGFTSNYSSSSSDQTTYYTDVYFKDNTNKTVYIRSCSSSSFVTDEVGDEVTVRYIKGKSEDGKITSFFFDFWGVAIILGAIGILPAVVGFMLAWNVAVDIFMKRNSKNFTKIIVADVTQVYVNQSLALNQKSPYIIEAEWIDKKTNESYIFLSEHIWEDPRSKVKDQILIKVDDENYNNYWMDISFLEKQ
ncbi:DUF3592 domain-containing protein [Tenacibaculum jejuense]|uniref:DUF3592 domain-containing protein n=1 Tax=Tenacibaculum jejuense TaxID=584609 RepID=A0A238U5N9_9FLAO|nr:DUF3592 domain-containing protein [Tenacibaculum jejuense]SNR14531.1 protein of unknown function [Tenacibaculum jejuense]